MLNNLRAELIRKNLNPEKAVEQTLNCTYKTAKSKTSGESDFSLTEAFKIMDTFFPDDQFDFKYLFMNEKTA